MTASAIYCIASVSRSGVATLINHCGGFAMYSHVGALERRHVLESGAAAPARSVARTAAAAPRAATPPLSNTGINKGEA